MNSRKRRLVNGKRKGTVSDMVCLVVSFLWHMLSETLRAVTVGTLISS
jgi:hypothetical protein